MAVEAPVPSNVLDALRRIETCMVCNAIETFELRLRNTGYADSRIRCMFCDLPPMVGYAATARVRTEEPPITDSGFRGYRARTDWWSSILRIPEPRIVVLEDMDKSPGVGAFLGDGHAAILRALGCVGYVTDGAVRELPQIQELGLQLFAGSVSVSHAYAHIFDFGTVIRIGGLEVRPGDLLHGDRHGLLSVPVEIASKIPAAADRLQNVKQTVVDYCLSPDFSVDGLRKILNGLIY
jgi:4-hydroxy-4-methyl-2-oxoglutarate aldolase